MDFIKQANVGGTTYNLGLPNVYKNDKSNLCVETTAADQYQDGSKTKGGKINIESASDIQIKPGDDITLYSHHRAENKQDEVAVKVLDGSDIPVKLQLNASEITLTTKDKEGNNANVFDINVNSGTDAKGYLKVRAQAIDLRCEEHGGIALQPKGEDGQHHMNKIKFEHGGGDGLEFGTFNTEKTSIFTNEYRFNKDGVWKMATREKVVSDKADANDATTAYKYQKQTDDFYDIVDDNDAQCTTEDIIKTAAAFNHNPYIHAKMTSKGNLEIASVEKYNKPTYRDVSELPVDFSAATPLFYNWEDFTDLESLVPSEGSLKDIAPMFIGNLGEDEDDIVDALKSAISQGTSYPQSPDNIYIFVSSEASGSATGYYLFSKVFNPDDIEHHSKTPNINIESDADVSIEAAGKIKFGGELDFGSTFNFGETDKGIETIIKRTAKNKTKDCGIVKVVATNNSSSAYSFNTIWDPTANDNAGANQSETTTSVAAGESQVIAQCSVYDIIKLVNYMKDNNQGPWAAQQ